MARKTKKQIEELKKKFNVDRLWSWSRYNCYKTSKYEYMLKYIQKAKETRKNIYGDSGNLCHDVLEKFYSGEIKYEDMISEYEEGLLTFNLAELKYDRSDDEKNEKIAQKYEACIKHFFKNHKIINHKLALEKFITIKIKPFVFQGYIDSVYKVGDKYYITDWKTSSIYKGKKIDKEKGQLILYAEGLRQMGVPLNQIVCQWAFLKYVDITFMQKNGREKTMTAERHIWVGKIKSKLRMNLKDIGWEEDEIDEAVNYATEFNTIENLPKEVQDLYKVEDCYVEIPFNQDEIDELKEDIYHTLMEIHKKENEYAKTEDDEIFWDEVNDGNSYYFANLCGYSAEQHKPYGQYLSDREMFKDKEEEEVDSSDWMDELNLT